MRLFALALLAVCWLMAPISAHATAQEPDVIVIDGKRYSLNTNPLQAWLEKSGWHPPANASRRTSNWRGYIAEWEAVDDELRLTRVMAQLWDNEARKNSEIDIRPELFPGKKTVTADWYSGALIIPDGEITRYVHMGYGSSYARYIVLRVEQGKIRERLALDEAEFERYRDYQFRLFQKTDEYQRAFERLQKRIPSMSEPQLIDFMREFYSERYLAM